MTNVNFNRLIVIKPLAESGCFKKWQFPDEYGPQRKPLGSVPVYYPIAWSFPGPSRLRALQHSRQPLFLPNTFCYESIICSVGFLGSPTVSLLGFRVQAIPSRFASDQQVFRLPRVMLFE